jgi:hypothetical protein
MAVAYAEQKKLLQIFQPVRSSSLVALLPPLQYSYGMHNASFTPSSNTIAMFRVWLIKSAQQKHRPYQTLGSNLALNLAPFGRWTLRDKAAQRRLALR